MATMMTMMDTNLLLPPRCSPGDDDCVADSVELATLDASPLVPGAPDDAGVMPVARLVMVGLSVPGPVVDAPGTTGRLANPACLDQLLS